METAELIIMASGYCRRAGDELLAGRPEHAVGELEQLRDKLTEALGQPELDPKPAPTTPTAE